VKQKRRITTGLPPGEGFTFIVCEQNSLHTFEDKFAGATRDLVTTEVAFLMRPVYFIEKFFVVLCFLSGVMAFLSGLIVTMTWLHFLVPLGLNVNVSSFLRMLSFMILAATSIVAPVVLKMDVCRQIPLILGRPFLNTTKSTGTKQFPILTGISSAVPTGSQID
jgi:hypothetical protein